jgi:L-threonylcarbamoyladenylate synthase
MNTEIITTEDNLAIQRALAILREGGLVAFPTDTVYGLGALVFDKAAVDSIYTAKGRPEGKAIPVLIGEVDDLEKVAVEVSETALILAARFWPGPLTIVVGKRPGLPEAVSTTPTVGVRIPNHPVARTLLRQAGPMAVTSANLSGQASLSTAQEVFDQLGGRIAFILDGGRTPGGVPSTVVSCVGGETKVLREGPISKSEILAALGKTGG